MTPRLAWSSTCKPARTAIPLTLDHRTKTWRYRDDWANVVQEPDHDWLVCTLQIFLLTKKLKYELKSKGAIVCANKE